MIKLIQFFLILISLPAFASLDPMMEASKLQNDLESAITRFVPKDSFIVQVNASTETVSEKRLVEGESLVQSGGANEVVVPPLPGFTPPVEQVKQTPPNQTRQVYKMVDRDVLKSLDVQITLDSALSKETVAQVKNFVQSFVAGIFGSKAKIAYHQVQMKGVEASNSLLLSSAWLPWILFGLALLGLAFLLLRKKKEQPRPVYPSVVGEEPVERQDSVSDGDYKMIGRQNHSGRVSFAPPNSGQLALPAGTSKSSGQSSDPKSKYPALPASETFVDRRYELLQTLLRNASIFRLYYNKLAEAAKLELYAALRGPAFDSLLETLGISIPPGADDLNPPTEEQMLFYLKNFNEFIHANIWQNEQFFGFLQQLSNDHLLTLVRQENALISSLLLKFMKPEQSAFILKSLKSEERIQILEQSSRIASISSEELLSIEEKIRSQANKLPKFLLGISEEEITYWTNVLTHADNQDELLLDLEKSRPELYQKLARFRFHLEDVPSLPQPLTSKVLEEIENDELALALLTCPRDIVDYVLGEIPPNRRTLLNSQLTMYHGLPKEKLKQARVSVTQKFREVMV
ncbi:MAG: FliG C-terminal domain-containing protein [Bacteriovoracia bacterium]